LVLLLAVVGAAPALAHHSFAMYDHTGTLTLKGEVTRFQWTNPHAYLELDVPQDDGTRKHYTLEMTSINMMQRQGWRSSTIKAGDKVKAVMAPLLSGQAGGLLLEVTLPDGRVLEPGVPAAASYRRTLDREEGR
jgi:hypothetical protein